MGDHFRGWGDGALINAFRSIISLFILVWNELSACFPCNSSNSFKLALRLFFLFFSSASWLKDFLRWRCLQGRQRLTVPRVVFSKIHVGLFCTPHLKQARCVGDFAQDFVLRTRDAGAGWASRECLFKCFRKTSALHFLHLTSSLRYFGLSSNSIVKVRRPFFLVHTGVINNSLLHDFQWLPIAQWRRLYAARPLNLEILKAEFPDFVSFFHAEVVSE